MGLLLRRERHDVVLLMYQFDIALLYSENSFFLFACFTYNP